MFCKIGNQIDSFETLFSKADFIKNDKPDILYVFVPIALAFSKKLAKTCYRTNLVCFLSFLIRYLKKCFPKRFIEICCDNEKE